MKESLTLHDRIGCIRYQDSNTANDMLGYFQYHAGTNEQIIGKVQGPIHDDKNNLFYWVLEFGVLRSYPPSALDQITRPD